MDTLPIEIRTRIAHYVLQLHPYRSVGLASLAKLARASKGWREAALPVLYETFDEARMGERHIAALLKSETIHAMVQVVSVSLLDLCRPDKDEDNFLGGGGGGQRGPGAHENDIEESGLIVGFDFEKETAAIDYDLLLSEMVGRFTHAHTLRINTCVWDSLDYRRSKYTLHSLLSLSPRHITSLEFTDVEHWEGMMLIAQFLRATPACTSLSVHIRGEGAYRDAWQRDDFRWTTREHFTCVQMCRALAEASTLRRLDFGDMTLAMNHPEHPARGFVSALQHISLGPQSSAGPIVYDMVRSSAHSLKSIRLDPENLVQAHYYGTVGPCPSLELLHLDGLNPDTDYPGTLVLFAGSPVKHLKLDGYVDIGSVIQWIQNDELPELKKLDVDLMDYCSNDLRSELEDVCAVQGIALRLDAWPSTDRDMGLTLEDYLG